jgi:hypothetical protein
LDPDPNRDSTLELRLAQTFEEDDSHLKIVTVSVELQFWIRDAVNNADLFDYFIHAQFSHPGCRAEFRTWAAFQQHDAFTTLLRRALLLLFGNNVTGTKASILQTVFSIWSILQLFARYGLEE